MSRAAITALTAAVVLSGLAAPSLAKIPPMSKKELTASADAIVTGTVLKVRDAGNKYRDRCYVWQNRHATFRVTGRSKGTTARIITIVYSTRLGDANPARPCDGGRTSYSLTPGTKYQLYLSRSGKPGQRRYGFINWAGVKRL